MRNCIVHLYGYFEARAMQYLPYSIHLTSVPYVLHNENPSFHDTNIMDYLLYPRMYTYSSQKITVTLPPKM